MILKITFFAKKVFQLIPSKITLLNATYSTHGNCISSSSRILIIMTAHKRHSDRTIKRTVRIWTFQYFIERKQNNPTSKKCQRFGIENFKTLLTCSMRFVFYFNPSPGGVFSITRPGSGGRCPPGVSKLNVVALREKRPIDCSLRLNAIGRIFFTLGQHLI